MLVSPKHTPRPYRPSEDERITDRKKILSILRQLHADHQLLSVTVADCPDVANSAILGIKDDRGYFLLDELSSTVAHNAFSKRKKALIQGRLRGTELHFQCDLIRSGSNANIILYAIAIPDEIISKQRREQFRLHLSPALSVPVTVPNLDGYKVAGEAHDLSASGLGALLHTDNSPERGILLPDVAICLPHSRPFIVKIEVRFARVDNARHLLRMGGRFVALTQQQQRKLEQFLAEQQRKRCRHDSR